MSKRDMNNLVSAKSLGNAVVTAAADGAGIDLQGFQGALCVLNVGTLGGTSTPTINLELQESDDDSTYAAVAAADLVGGTSAFAIVAANNEAIYQRSYIGHKRYLRWTCESVSGTSPTAPISGTVIKGHGRHQTA